MVTLLPILRKAYWLVAAGIALYGSCLFLLTYPSVQRFALYGHKLCTWHDLNNPEQFGFAITPFRFESSDQESLYAWHILPLGLYAKHEEKLLKDAHGFAKDVRQRTAFELLRTQPDARLVISFHGNAGHLAQYWRSDTYRALAHGGTENIHVLAFDYRGFGYSTGVPDENGLIRDGIAAVHWALHVAKVPRERILIFGQSLGTFVATAVAEHYAVDGTEFAGLVLVAGFTSLPDLLTSYAIAGYIPVLSPLKRWPEVVAFLNSYLIDTWQTAQHLAGYVKASKRLRLSIVHALDDIEIPWQQSEGLFRAAVNATKQDTLPPSQFQLLKEQKTMRSDGGTFVTMWDDGDDTMIRQQIIAYGGHSRILTYAPIALAVVKAFEW